MLSKHPNQGLFSRTVSSGARWGQRVFLSKSAMNNFSGDLVCPEKFKFVIESKIGYNDVDLCACFSGECKELDNFIKQITKDSDRCGRLPLLIWKKDRKNQVAFIQKTQLKSYPDVYLLYSDWVGVDFNWLLKLDDTFFFNE